MFNRELKVVIQRKHEIKTQLKSTESCRSKLNNVFNQLQKHSPTRPEKTRKGNVKKFGLKLNGNTENKENYYLTTDSQGLSPNNDIDKFRQKCVVKVVRFKPRQDVQNHILKDSTINNNEASDKTGIITDSPKLNSNNDKYHHKSVLKVIRSKPQEDLANHVLKKSTTNTTEASDKTGIIVGDFYSANRSSDLFKEYTTSNHNASVIENPTSKSDTLEASLVRCDGDDDHGDISVTKFKRASGILHADILGIQTSTPLRSTNPATPVAKRLRNKEHKNYRESSLSLTEPLAEVQSNPLGPKVPVYKRTLPDNLKPKADLYEFDDVDFDIQCRKRKNTSEKFDKTMHSILEKLEKKEKTKNRRYLKDHNTINKKSPIYETKVNAAVDKVMDKIKAKRQSQNRLPKQNNCKKSNENEHQMQNKLILRDRNKNETYQIQPLNEEISDNKQYTQCNGHNKLNHRDAANEIIDTSNVINIVDQNKSKAIYTDGRSIHPLEDDSNLSEFHGFTNTRSMLMQDRSDVTDNFQGFNVHEQSSATQMAAVINNGLSCTFGRKDTSINILSSIVLQPAQKNLEKKMPLHDYFLDLHENYRLDNNFGFDYDEKADAAMMTQARKIVRIVWRYADIINRNPHFLLIKSNALPSLNQDLVIDYALVERIEKQAASKRTKIPHAINDTVAKATYQKKISEYIECPVPLEKDHENAVSSSSLYDYEEFHIPARPRRVLGMLQPEQVISTPKNHAETSVPFLDVSIIEKDKENSNGASIEQDTENTLENALQIRTRRHEMRKYSRQIKNNQNVVKKDEVITLQEQLSSSDTITEDKETNKDKGEDGIQIFDEDEPELLDDVSITIPKMNYPSRRRKRLKSDASDMDDEGKPKKKKKDLMTKEEEMEFEKWASKFNEMCEEVEKYELEVD
nr:unnamed protein product [Callosobruchus analis]